MEYIKKIEITDTGMVIASVYRNDSSNDSIRVGIKFFSSSPFFNKPKHIEKRADNAHKWADEYIKVCKIKEQL